MGCSYTASRIDERRSSDDFVEPTSAGSRMLTDYHCSVKQVLQICKRRCFSQ